MISRRGVVALAAASGLAPAVAAEIEPTVLSDLAPHGALRAAMNYGNPVLTNHDPATGQPGGVAVALAYELGRRLGVPVTLVAFQEAGEVTKALSAGVWDVAFLAIDPVRAAEITFTPPYVLIEGCYVVGAGSPLQAAGDVDRPGIRIAVAAGSAYDLFLTRALKLAQLMRFPTSDAAVAAFAQDHLEVLAGVKQPLQQLTAAHKDWRLLDGRFMSIAQAMALPRGRPAGAAYLDSFIATMKASGFVADALRASGHGDVGVPPV